MFVALLYPQYSTGLFGEICWFDQGKKKQPTEEHKMTLATEICWFCMTVI